MNVILGFIVVVVVVVVVVAAVFRLRLGGRKVDGVGCSGYTSLPVPFEFGRMNSAFADAEMHRYAAQLSTHVFESLEILGMRVVSNVDDAFDLFGREEGFEISTELKG